MSLLKTVSSMLRGHFLISGHLALRGQIWLILLLSITHAKAENPIEQSFQSSVLPILQANCLACHGALSPQADLDLRTVDSIFTGGKSGTSVIPGSSDRSLLVQKVVSGAMPPGDQRLSPAEIELIRRWIDRATPATEEVASVQITEKDVLPIFLMRCVACHGKRKQEGGLDLRTIAGQLKGGKSGPALVPGDPGNSLLFRRILDEEMPPSELLYEYRVRPPTLVEVETLRPLDCRRCCFRSAPGQRRGARIPGLRKAIGSSGRFSPESSLRSQSQGGKNRSVTQSTPFYWRDSRLKGSTFLLKPIATLCCAERTWI